MVPVHYQSGNTKPLCKLADYMMCIFDTGNVLFIQSKHEKKQETDSINITRGFHSYCNLTF